MNYRSSKFKGQSSREAPKENSQDPNTVDGVDTWWAESENDGELVLKDQPGDGRHIWDLLERTAVFGERIVRFSKKISRDPSNNRLIDQLVGAGTSIGANYCEANEAVSKKDFKNIISHCVKEAKETKFFLRLPTRLVRFTVKPMNSCASSLPCARNEHLLDHHLWFWKLKLPLSFELELLSFST